MIAIFCNETTKGGRVRCYFALMQIVVVGVWSDLKGIQSQQLDVNFIKTHSTYADSPPSLLIHNLGLFGLSILSLL